METIIVSGLLGSGKTTFIQNLTGDVRAKTVVLVNDFGKLGIDGDVLAADGLHAIELPSGCICCTLKIDLITTISKIIEKFSPERLLIEPSGVASPSGVIEALGELNIKSFTVVGIVDAAEFLELHNMQVYGNFFLDQIVRSDIILVNKTDLSDEETIRATISLIESLNPFALVLRAVNGVAFEKYAIRPAPGSGLVRQSNDSHLHFDSISLHPIKSISVNALTYFFRELASGKYGVIIRAKGLFRTQEGPFRFDLSYGNINSEPFNGTLSESRVVIIGTGLQKDILIEKLGTVPRENQ